MIYGDKRKWFLVAVFSNVITSVNVQIAMPMYMPAPIVQHMYALSPPIAMAVELPIPVTKTTTTTSAPKIAIAMPVPVPMPLPVQIAVPAQPPPVFCQGKPRPQSCPPCPPCVCMPSCTPAFFSYCSSCHMKCRCRNTEEAPIPIPPHPPVPVPGPAYPLAMPAAVTPAIGPPPVVVVPIPPQSIRIPLPKGRRKRPHQSFLISSSSCDDFSDTWDSSISSDLDYLRAKRQFKRRRQRIFRRNAESVSQNSNSDLDNNLVHPVLSYVSENGDIKFESKISAKDAMEILNNESTRNGKKHNMNYDNSVLMSRNGRKFGRTYNKILSKDSAMNSVAKQGKSRVVFEPPPHKRIDSVAVSFQVT